MGYIEIHNADGLGGWVNFDDIPFIEIINCQLCNEPIAKALVDGV